MTDPIRDAEVNVEEIMEKIREQIEARKGGTGSRAGGLGPPQGERFPPEFYEHLYQLGISYNQVQPDLHVSEVSVPLIGPLIRWVRGKFHELVLFYVNQVAVRQMTVNTHIYGALNLISEELEREAAGQDAADGPGG